VKAPQIARPYFFEVFTVANFLILLFVLRNVTSKPFWTLYPLVLQIALGVLVQTLIGVAIRLTFAAFRGTAKELLVIYRSRGWLIDTLRFAIGCGLWTHTYAWIKLTTPVLHPHLFDQQLWNLDRTICFGYQPSFFVLSLFSAPSVMRLIDWTYAFVFFASLNIAMIFFASLPERRLRIAFMNSNALLWLTGGWLYVAVPSLGPAYRFPEVWVPLAPWLDRTQTFQRLLMTNYRNVLLSLRGARRPINIIFGIGAFPSLHVAFQTLALLWMRRQTKWGGPLFLVFVFFIFFGSLVTGWHYLVDGLAGAALAWACYAAAQRVPAIRA
jgi:hypothetical protein